MNIHLIANAHLDPVWLWDRREGLNEGITTCRTVLDLMDEFPELTFVRGEAAIYEHIERHDPRTFHRIARHVEGDRWDVVGGTWIQPDTNLPATETLARHFARGIRYFQEKFHRTVRVAWQADSFGHTAGLPEILRAAGIDSFAFTRPSAAQLPLDEPAFWWEGEGGARILAYRPWVGWYGIERDEMPRRLDSLLEAAGSGLKTLGCFYGLGNHGGGPTRRHLADLRVWVARHPEIKVVHSGLHRFFAALRREVMAGGVNSIPTHRGELNFCLRGCYASVARFKFAYRKAEALLARAERTDAVVSAALKRSPAKLQPPWDELLFNSFHDILPGSGIERALDEQVESLGAVLHASREAEFAALNALARRVDTRVATVTVADRPSGIAALVWNPHPHPFEGHVELEVSLDHRPLWLWQGRPEQVPVRVLGSDGAPLPFQFVATEHSSMPDLPWRKRVLVPVAISPLGWTMLEMGLAEGPSNSGGEPPAVSLPVTAVPGNDGVLVWDKIRLSAVTVEDPWGSWGGMNEEPESIDLSTVRHSWKVVRAEMLERGTERSTLWVRMEGGNSWLELRLSQCRGRDAVDAAARVLWNERSARLKLVMSGVRGQAEFEVPGGTIARNAGGELPGGRWVRIGDFGFASDALYNFDLKEGALRATIVRASRYANDVKTAPGDVPWLPAVDVGELKFRFLLTREVARLARLARELEQPPVVLTVVPGKGDLPRSGSFAELSPPELQLLALKRAEDGKGWILRLQAPAGLAVKPEFQWLGTRLALGKIQGGAVASWRLVPHGGKWKALRTNLMEETVRPQAGVCSR